MNLLKRSVSTLVQGHRKRSLTRHLSSNIGKRIGFLLLILLMLICFNSLAMMHFESMSLGDALWMSLVTITTVGYGDQFPVTFAGRLITIVTLFIFAISVLTSLISEVIEWRFIIADKKRKGFWVWKSMSGHIQIINSPNIDTERYLKRLLTEILATEKLKNTPVHLLSRKYPDGLPQGLTQMKLIHATGAAEDISALKKVNIAQAKHILILARDAVDTLSDSVTFDVLSLVKTLHPTANIVVEAVADQNQQRFMQAGANVVIRPIRAYPELVVRAMVNPGTERVIEDLLDSSGDSLYREDIIVNAKSWLEVVTAALNVGCGTPIGYICAGEIFLQPKADEICTGDGLILISKQETVERIDMLRTQLK